jgi:hypothetical protein
MMRKHINKSGKSMSPDAYAGLLRLLLTPGGRLPKPSADVDAYIEHANRAEPLSAVSRRALGQRLDRAA